MSRQSPDRDLLPHFGWSLASASSCCRDSKPVKVQNEVNEGVSFRQVLLEINEIIIITDFSAVLVFLFFLASRYSIGLS